MSACVTVYSPWQEIVAPAASEATGVVGLHASSVAFGSDTVTLVSVDVPMLVAVTVKVSFCPTWA